MSSLFVPRFGTDIFLFLIGRFVVKTVEAAYDQA